MLGWAGQRNEKASVPFSPLFAQINFGVILNESLADAVKITVIATGFQPENAPLAERPVEVRVQTRIPEPPPPPEPDLEPEPAMIAETADLFPGEDDLDRPAYLRHGGLLN